MKTLTKFLFIFLSLQIPTLWAADEFPHRSLYPKVETIELEALHTKFDEVVIFDVRSTYEYQTLHINGSKHLALNDRNFTATLKDIRKTENRPFVFYCNGHTCKKSYKATQKARKDGIDNVFAYDAGIFVWTKAYPDKAMLLGKTPVDPARLLGKEKLNAHMLSPEEFGIRVGENSITLDIREAMQKDALNLFPTRQRSVALDNDKLKNYVTKAKSQKKTLLIYDAVGKQVRWLQYYLEDEGLTDYFFMKGGAKAFLAY